jgi:predicted lysophospholipase L1 biosynthesis ABC-type transport system permease subunit
MAAVAWPGESPLGKRVTIDFQTDTGMTELRETEVVGVVPPSREVTLHGDEPPIAYLPAWSTRAVNRALVRTAGAPMELVPLIRELVKDLGIRRPLDNIRAVRHNIEDATEGTRFVLTLTGMFSALAVFLAALGIYGVVSHLVGQRQHEIGVRMALGASRQSVRSMVMRQGLTVVVTGLGLGVALALALTRVIGSMLYGVSPTDPVTFALVAGLLLAVAALACLIPATRATRVEPVTALREA